MRLIQISVDEQRQDAVVDVLQNHNLGYTITDGSGEQSEQVIINFVVPADAVEHVLAKLEEVGFDKRTYTVSLDAEFANFEHVDLVQNTWGNTPNRLAPDALRSKAKDLRRNSRSYLWMMVLSAIVATAGLLLGSPAVVVGSMVIAPIVSPVLTASVGLIRNDRDMFIDSIHMQAYGLGIAIVTATAFGWAVKQVSVVPGTLAIEQMELMTLRISPSILAIAIGVAAGAAGAYGLATKGDVTIVGVMIAAALIPTAGAIGIGLAWGNIVLALGAFLLLVLSMVGINVGGSVMLYYLDYRPDNVDRSLFAFDDAYRMAVVAVTLTVVLATVLVVGVGFYQQSAFERTVNNAVTDVLESDEYEDLRVMSTSIEYTAPLVSDGTDVTITLARTTDDEFPEIPSEFDRAITDQTGQDVTVRVRYVDFHQSDSSGSGSDSTADALGDGITGGALQSDAAHPAPGRPADGHSYHRSRAG